MQGLEGKQGFYLYDNDHKGFWARSQGVRTELLDTPQNINEVEEILDMGHDFLLSERGRSCLVASMIQIVVM